MGSGGGGTIGEENKGKAFLNARTPAEKKKMGGEEKQHFGGGKGGASRIYATVVRAEVNLTTQTEVSTRKNRNRLQPRTRPTSIENMYHSKIKIKMGSSRRYLKTSINKTPKIERDKESHETRRSRKREFQQGEVLFERRGVKHNPTAGRVYGGPSDAYKSLACKEEKGGEED